MGERGMSDNGQRAPLPGCMIGPSEPCDAFQRQTARIAELEAELAAERERREAAEAALAAERERREAAEAELAAKRGRREAAEVILREMAKLYAGQIDNTGNYCNQLHDSARAHFARYYKD